MTNKEKQAQLDRKKWLLSESLEMDCSGSMDYCYYCTSLANDGCNSSQEEREEKTLCAKAYNKAYKNRE